jgi:enamine deaminase RidA (YjgF/YER057c/UK114 family)
MKVEYINLDGLHKPIGFTQVISGSGPHKTIYVGGQEEGETVGKGNLKQQTQQVLMNIEKALEAAGGKL